MKTAFTLLTALVLFTAGAFAQNFKKIDVPKSFVADGIAIDGQGNYYVATKAILRSTDKGASWRIIGDIAYENDRYPLVQVGEDIQDLTFTGGKRLYGNLDDEIGIYSEDMGKTWVFPESPILIVGHNDDTLYGRGSGGGLRILKPGETYWKTLQEIGDFKANFVHKMKSGIIIAVGNHEFKAYMPTLNQWIPVSYSGLDNTRISTAADIGLNLWIGTDSGLYQVNTVAQNATVVNLPGAPSNGTPITDIITVGDAEIYVATMHFGIFRSTDMGTSWNNISSDRDLQLVSGLAWSNGSLYTATASGVFKIQVAESIEVENLTSNFNITIGGLGTIGDKIAFSTPVNIYTGTEGDFTTSWSNLDIPNDLTAFWEIPFIAGKKLFFTNTAYLGGWDGQYFTRIKSDFYALQKAIATKDGFIWAIDANRLQLSKNGGAKFSAVGPEGGVSTYDVWANCTNNSVLFDALSNLYYSKDAGASWGIIPFESYGYGIREALFYGDTLIVADYRNNIHYSENLGENWTDITPGSSVGFTEYSRVNDLARGTDGTVYLATSVGLFYKLNATASFQKINKPEIAGMPASLAGVDDKGELYFGFMNGIYKVTNKGNGISAEKVNAFKIAPNPACENLQILSAELPERVEIYSAAGALRMTIDRPERSISIGSLEPGAYIVKIYAQSGVETQSFIKE